MKTTTCKKCGKSIEYNTNKPKYCSEHSKSKLYRKPKKGIPKRSKLELKVQDWVMYLFKDRAIVFDGYFSWLLSPKGYPMQLDILIYGNGLQRIAIEVDGIQHSEKQFFQTEEQFKYLLECDKIKERLVKSKDIKFYRIPHTCDSIDKFKDIIKEVL